MSDPVESESVPVVTPEAPSEPGSATAPEAALMNVPPVPEATNMADDEVKVTSEIESGSKSGETEAQPAVVEAPTPVVDAEPLPEKLESVLSNSSTGSRTKSKDRGGEGGGKGSKDVTPTNSISKTDSGGRKGHHGHHGHHGGHEHKKHHKEGETLVTKTKSDPSAGAPADMSEEEEALAARKEKLEKIKKMVDDVIESSPVVVVMAVLTVWALFSDDLRLAAADMEADSAFTAIISIAFFLFVFEIIAASFCKDDYLYIPKQEMLKGETVLQSLRRRLEIGSFYFWLDAIATISLIFEIDWMNASLSSEEVSDGSDDSAARAQRLVRVVRMVRLVRLVKLYKYSTNLRNKGQEEEREGEDKAKSDDDNDEVETKKEVAKVEESRVGAAMTDLTNRRVIILILILLIAVPLLTVTEIDLEPALALEFIHKAAIGVYVGSDSTYNNALDYANEYAVMHTDVISVDFTYNGASGQLTSWKNSVKRDKLRDSEVIELKQTTDLLTTTMVFDNSSTSRLTAAFAIYTTIFVVFLLITGTIAFSADVDRLVIGPIERMVELVQKISANPLGVEYKMLGAEDGFVEGMETTALLATITKIGRLMRVGFGEAGADVIGKNMSGVGGKLNLLGKGAMIESIFGFCDVRQFTDTTECLQEEVMLFVNRIGHILHSIVVQCSGAANKNIGDAFLLTWKVEKRYTAKERTALADQALLTFCKALIELGRYQEFIINFSAASTARLYKRFPGYNVRIGSGLHKGWAIEGAIGSHRKIDASYLSPHVNFTEFLESSTKAYGTPLLISEPCFNDFSNTAKRYIRKVDVVRKSKKEDPVGLYTYDSDLSIDWADPNRKLIAKKLMPTLKAITGKFQAAARRASIGAAARLAMTPEQIAAEAEKKKEKAALEAAEKAANDKKTKPPVVTLEKYREDVWRVDPDLVDLRHRVNESFRKTFHEGMKYYENGEWEDAKTKFERCVHLSKNNGPPDGPSTFLLKFMGETDFVAPSDWQGYRWDG